MNKKIAIFVISFLILPVLVFPSNASAEGAILTPQVSRDNGITKLAGSLRDVLSTGSTEKINVIIEMDGSGSGDVTVLGVQTDRCGPAGQVLCAPEVIGVSVGDHDVRQLGRVTSDRPDVLLERFGVLGDVVDGLLDDPEEGDLHW